MIHDSKNRFSVASFADIQYKHELCLSLEWLLSDPERGAVVLQPLICLELENSMERGLDVQQIIASKNVCPISMQKPVVIISGIFGRPVTPVTCGADP